MFSSFPPPDPKLRTPLISFRPWLHIADAITRPILRSMTTTNRLPFAQALPHSRFSSNTNSTPKPRLWSSDAQIRSLCYRCGGGGHHAKFCKTPVRCYSCGAFGHKRFKCSSFKVKPMPIIPKETGSGCDDVYWMLQTAQTLDPCYSSKGLVDLGFNSSSSSTSPDNGEQFMGASDLDLRVVVNSSLPTEGLPSISGDQANGSKHLVNGSSNIDLSSGSEPSNGARSSVLQSHKLFDKVGLEALMNSLDVATYVVHPVGDQKSGTSSCLKLFEITIIGKLSIASYVECPREAQAAITFFIKPRKFFLYCFLAALRHHTSLVPPVGSWRSQLYSVHSNFNYSSPDSAAVDRCIFGNEKVFNSKSNGVKCKKKLAFSDKVRRSPKLSVLR